MRRGRRAEPEELEGVSMGKAFGRWRMLAALGVVVTLLATWTAPAAASKTSKVVDGSSCAPYDWGCLDFDDESDLSSYGSYWDSNYAGMLQLILWADGYMTQAQVDCKFGPITANALTAWQAHELDTYIHNPPSGTADGIFDRPWRDWISTKFITAPMQSDGSYYLYYEGEQHDVQFHRQNGSSSPAYLYDMENPFNPSEWHHVTYGSAYFTFCNNP
jgi:hypothetical protein